MRAGLLTENIDVLKLTETVDAYGAVSHAWAKDYSTKARVVFGKGDRTLQVDEVVNDYTYTFTIRHFLSIDEQVHRIKWKGDIYRIVSIFRDRFETQVKAEKYHE